ncbi:MAG: hypothetical protein ABJ205_06345 [Erythrobacter sp.]|uniref:hypothetical protein n=1 Tax=Erythrobacter sp. TaxID=1042 RepID=UPI0032633C8A
MGNPKSIVRSTMIALAISASLISSGAAAQPGVSTQDGPTMQRMKRLFEARVVTIMRTCHLGQYAELRAELRSTRDTVSDNHTLLSTSPQPQDANQRRDRADRRQDLYHAGILLRDYDQNLYGSCDPASLERSVIFFKEVCAPDYTSEKLAKLQMVVGLYKQRAEAARALGGNSTISSRKALVEYEAALKNYKDASSYRPSDCEEPPPNSNLPNSGDIDDGGDTIEIADIGSGPDGLLAGAAPTDDLERQWSWVVGLWDIDGIGGQIEFRVEADGTLSAYIAATNQHMIDHGYVSGMQVARGFRMAGTDGVTWRYWANSGEVFSAQYPDRGPGDTWGTARWIEGGVMFLPKNRANVSINPLLKNRLANFTNPLVRPDTSALDSIIAEYNERTASLDEAGARTERLELVQSAIDALNSQSASSIDAQRAAQMLALLNERGALRDNPELTDAINTLEQSSHSADEAAAWQTLVAHMAASGAHFSQPIRGNDYDEQAAAQMFRVVRYASTLQDDLRDARGALANSNMSRTTAALARLQGIATLAGNPRNQTAGSLMDGIRNIGVRSGRVPGPISAFEFPAAIATGLLDNTIAGVRASADALVDVRDAIGGDQAAEQRAISAARRVNTILSAPGYADSVVRSVGNRVIERIPFVRTMANWLR